MNEKPFEVGEWVWVWSERQWLKIESVDYARCEVRFEGRGMTHFTNITSTPIIPPKPKRPKRLARFIAPAIGDTSNLPPGFTYIAHRVPTDAVDIECTYLISEDGPTFTRKNMD